MMINEAMKREVYNIAVGMHCKGFRLKAITRRLHKELTAYDKELERLTVEEWVIRAIHHYQVKGVS